MSRGEGGGAQIEPGQDGYDPLRWVNDLSFRGVAGDVNLMHDEFYRMQKMLIEKLTETFLDKDEFFEYKGKKINIDSCIEPYMIKG